jgi:hypothetical protein
LNRAAISVLRLALLAPMLAASVWALAADKSAISPADDISPMEKHPECMNRTTEAMSSKCVEQSEGTPRRKYPPKTTATKKPAPASPPAKGDSTTTTRKSAADGSGTTK